LPDTSQPTSQAVAQPVPLAFHARTGQPMAAMPLPNLANLVQDIPGAAQRIQNSKDLGSDYMVSDPNDINQAGWCILFASDEDPAVIAQLQPLIDLRQSQIHAPTPCTVFSGKTGVAPGQTALGWAAERGVSLDALVDPFAGVPFYLLIVGSPQRIPFEFQAALKLEWAVGRLYFDDIEDYGRYARAVVQYETAANKPLQRKNAAVWVTRNPGDLATALLSGAICQDFLSSANPLGALAGFHLDAFPNEKATHAQLGEILRGNLPGGPPAVFFTGSHGCDYAGEDPALQLRMQGALATQEWIPGTPASPQNVFSADDIPDDAKVLGSIGFLFACFSGGCPADNSYYLDARGAPIPISPQPIVSRLAQALLSRGALAIIGHLDMAFPYTFRNASGTPQTQAVRNPLELLMRGKRAGLATDSLSLLWSSRSAQLDQNFKLTDPNPADPNSATPVSNLPISNPAALSQIGQMILARDDARNYILLGDPAVQLRIGDLA
jgi:hypothetical protein